jgi:hypothetical protein
MAAPAVFKDRDFIVAAATQMALLAQIREIGEHIVFTDHFVGHWDHQFADMLQGGFARIDEQAATAKTFIIGLAHGRRVGANQIKVNAGFKPLTANNRLLATDCRADQVSRSSR